MSETDDEAGDGPSGRAEDDASPVEAPVEQASKVPARRAKASAARRASATVRVREEQVVDQVPAARTAPDKISRDRTAGKNPPRRTAPDRISIDETAADTEPGWSAFDATAQDRGADQNQPGPDGTPHGQDTTGQDPASRTTLDQHAASQDPDGLTMPDEDAADLNRPRPDGTLHGQHAANEDPASRAMPDQNITSQNPPGQTMPNQDAAHQNRPDQTTPDQAPHSETGESTADQAAPHRNLPARNAAPARTSRHRSTPARKAISGPVERPGTALVRTSEPSAATPSANLPELAKPTTGKELALRSSAEVEVAIRAERPDEPQPIGPGPDPDLASRITILDALLEATEGRLTPETTATTTEIARQIHQRALLSPDHVVTVLAGATGTGKSSLFNALIRFELSPVGLIRPTTLSGLACVWDPDHAPGAAALLDRIGVEERRRTLRGSLLDGAQRQAEPELAPLVLVDLPDHDSGMQGHRDETDRAAVTADLLVFVTDPQKYADAEWHERYLRKLVHHQGSIAVVLNKIDTLSPADARACINDCDRLLRERGLRDVRLVVTSTRTGAGLDQLRGLIAERIWRKQAALLRSSSDIDHAAALIEAELRTAASPTSGTLSAQDREAVCKSLGEGTGARALADLIDATYRRRASAVTGWPIRHGVLALHSRSRGISGRYHPWTAPVAAGPAAPPIQRSDVESAVDDAIATASEGLPPLWTKELRKIGDACVRDLTDTLDATLSGTEVGSRLLPRWWTTVQVVHWMLLTAALIGFSGVIASALFGGTSSLNMPDTPIPFPALVFLTSLAAGAVVDLGCQITASRAAVALRERVAARMTERVCSAVDQLLFAPLTAELDRYAAAREHIRDLKGNAG